MAVKTVKRIASDVLRVGQSKIRIKPGEIKRVEEALTREDVRNLVAEGIVYAEEKRGVSRTRARKKHKQKKKGKRSGIGSRKGRKYARVPRKLIWMNRVRSQRALLRDLVGSGKLGQENYRRMYLMIKGGAFKSKAQLSTYLKENQLVK